MLPLLPIAHIVPDPVFSGGLPPAEHYTFPCMHRVAAPGELSLQAMFKEGAQAGRLNEGKELAFPSHVVSSKPICMRRG